jgi:hypothetical protein
MALLMKQRLAKGRSSQKAEKKEAEFFDRDEKSGI